VKDKHRRRQVPGVAAAFSLGLAARAGGDEGTPLLGAHLRVARPTDRLDEVVAFYRDGLGLETFVDPDGYRVVLQNARWSPR
jgi:hypothetical protein